MKVLFVCKGNICRSPTAEGVFRSRLQQAGLAGQVEVDSAGIGDWHIGKAPDSRACRVARRRGYQLDELSARQFKTEDFERFDLILAMDWDVLSRLQAMQPPASRSEPSLFLAGCGLEDEEVPDPYNGSGQDFEHVLDLIEQGCDTLLARTRRVCGAATA